MSNKFNNQPPLHRTSDGRCLYTITIGNLEDDDDDGHVYEDLSSQNKELSAKLTEALREKKKLFDENVDLREEVERLRSLNEQFVNDERKYKELDNKAQLIEQQVSWFLCILPTFSMPNFTDSG